MTLNKIKIKALTDLLEIECKKKNKDYKKIEYLLEELSYYEDITFKKVEDNK